MLILGLNAFHGDASASLLIDGQLVAAAEEERFIRVKHWAGFPRLAVEYCLAAAGARIEDVDHIAIGHDPNAHLLDRMMFTARQRPTAAFVMARLKNMASAGDPKLALAEQLGVEPRRLRAKAHAVEHHQAHMASAYYPSSFDEAAVVSIGGSGDFVSTTWGRAVGTRVEPLARVSLPHSLGIFYSAITHYLGFPKYGDEYKVMGLSAYAKPDYVGQLRKVVSVGGGSFALNLDYFVHQHGALATTWDGEPHIERLWSDKLVELLGPPREKDAPMDDRFKAIAASAQAVFEEGFFEVLHRARAMTGSNNLALAGGCALNSVACGRIRPKGLFRDLFIQPAAGNAGASLGAALHVAHQKLGVSRKFRQTHSFWGPAATQAEIEALLRDEKVPFETLPEDDLITRVAKLIAAGNVVGWFQGRMEWGPRALGHRSILVDPRRREMRDVLNARVKRLETFRPFAAALPLARAKDFFDQDHPDPFMTMVYGIKPEKRPLIPAVTHVDGTGRLGTVTRDENRRYFDLITAFGELTGVPVLLNASFNENEPIVCTPKEALDCFLRTKMDVLVLERSLLVKPSPRTPLP